MTEQEQRKIFSENLCRSLRSAGKIQADMVSQFGISKSTASSWCSGAKLPRMSTMQNIAEWLGVTVEELVLPGKEARIYIDEIIRSNEVGVATFTDAEARAEAFLLGYEQGEQSAKKEPATVSDDELSGLDRELISMLRQLSPDDYRRVQDFVAGLKAARTEKPFPPR